MGYEFYITLGFSHKDPIWSSRVRDYDIEDRRGMKRLTYVDTRGDCGFVDYNSNVPVVIEAIPVKIKYEGECRT